MKKRSFLSFVFVLMTLSLVAETRTVVDISVKTENITDSEAAWLAPAVAEKLESNLSKYTDFTFVNSANRSDIFNIQKQSESEAFDEEDAIEIGKLRNADYQLFTTIRKVGEEYTLSVKLTDITTGLNKVPAIVSKPRSAVQNLYSSNGSAADEITIEFCKALGKELSLTEKTYLINGDVSLSNEEKQSLYDAEIKLYNERNNAMNKEIEALKVSTDVNASIELEKLKAEKALNDGKLKLAQDNLKRVQEEALKKKEDALRDAERTEEQKERINSMANELNKKVQAVRNAKFENQSLIGQMQVIELKKKAVVDIHNTIMAERESICETTLKNVLEKKNQIEGRPYRSAELQADGTPAEKAIAQRQRIYEAAKDKLVATGQSDIDQVTGKLGIQKNTLLEEINSDYAKLTPRKISTLGNELLVTYGPYDGDRLGWDLNVTVKSDNLVLFQTKSFLSFETLTGKNPDDYMIDDYFAYLDDVDFYDSLFLRGEPILIYELEYSAKPEDITKPSQYNFKFYNFQCYDTQTLVVDGNNLSSSKTGSLTLNETNIIRQMTPSYNLNGLSDTLPALSELVTERIKIRIEELEKERLRIAKEKSERMARIAAEDPLSFSKPIMLPKGVDGSCGIEGTYILFGMWPQSLKAEGVTVSSNKENINGWTCYKGSDNCYYVKGKNTDSIIHKYREFNNGEVVDPWKDYYFKLEPIKWSVATDDYQGGKLLVAENILETKRFDRDDNNYEDSEIRAWLNDDFINSAFTKPAMEIINTVTVDNSEKSTGYKENEFACGYTDDKIFLLSFSELAKLKTRMRKPTDYSLFTGVHSYKNHGDWWLRSPSNRTDRSTFQVEVRYVDWNGSTWDNAVSTYYDTIGIVPALSIDFTVQTKITNVRVSDTDGVTIFWKNPSDTDFEKVKISCEGFDDIEIKGKPNEEMNYKFEGFNDKENYLVTIKTIDSNKNESDGIVLRFGFTNMPVVLPAGTDGSYGTKGTYVEFGKWPQSLKFGDVTVSSNKENVNGWECYKGSDSCYYVKAEARPYTSYYEFNNGETIEDGKEYYFKLEPIKWRVLTDGYQGGKLLLAENILTSKRFDSYSNNYEDSEIRAWLNDDFINRAFSKEEIDNINAVTVDNSIESTGEHLENKYACENTLDKIFLPSHKEITIDSYGFDREQFEGDAARRRKATDYSRAMGVKFYTSDYRDMECNNNGYYWWLRSPEGNGSYFVFVVYYDGKAYSDAHVGITNNGVVPALSVSF